MWNRFSGPSAFSNPHPQHSIDDAESVLSFNNPLSPLMVSIVENERLLKQEPYYHGSLNRSLVKYPYIEHDNLISMILLLTYSESWSLDLW